MPTPAIPLQVPARQSPLQPIPALDFADITTEPNYNRTPQAPDRSQRRRNPTFYPNPASGATDG
jgi:hypothetical protein